MSDAPGLIVAMAAGAVLGAVFFGGLWWTVRRAVVSQRPATWFLCSLVLRTLVTLGGFYAVSRGDWRMALACLGGFIAARMAVIRLTQVPPKGKIRLVKEGGP